MESKADHPWVATWAVDLSGRPIHVDAQWRAFTDQAADEIGRAWMDAIHPDDRATVDAVWTAAFERRHHIEPSSGGLDGFQTARKIRNGKNARNFMLVALSGWGQEDDRRRTREAGFDAHLTKPAPVETLRALLAGGQPDS